LINYSGFTGDALLMSDDDKSILEKAIKLLIPIPSLIALVGIILAAIIALTAHIGPPLIKSFDAQPDTINPGEAANLSWETVDASKVNIDGIGNVPLNGSMEVWPNNNTTTYTITATNMFGNSSPRSTILRVQKPIDDDSPSIEFAANPVRIITGKTSKLSWNVSGATFTFINNDIGKVAPNGTLLVNPDKSTTYTLTARNDQNGKTSTATADVTVKKGPIFQNLNFWFIPWKQYCGYLDGGSRYFKGYMNNSYFYDNSGGKRLPDDLVSKVEYQLDETKNPEETITSSQPLELNDSYTLAIKSIDENDNFTNLTLELFKEDQTIDVKTLSQNKIITAENNPTYYYNRSIGTGVDMIILAIHFSDIYTRNKRDTAIVDGIWQISDEPISISA
jgi:hypothetical protein